MRLFAILLLSAAVVTAIPSAAYAQQTPVPYRGTPPPVPALEPVAPGLAALHGQDPGSGIAYTRLFLTAGTPEPGPAAGSGQTLAPPDLHLPTLTAQCTQDRTGKLHFELFANFGGVPDPAFYAPWIATASDLHPPHTVRLMVTMNFLGYRKVSPYKRQFEQTVMPTGQLRYVPPGLASNNLEEVAFFLQYLRALPTLRLTAGSQSADFLTTPLLTQLSREPLCKASGI